ncbi:MULTISPECIES: FAD-binding oxidoreductase [unclassified Agrobacterium]|uniref:NAD(P)/FAD-dependent oxidoreductase n=1 Tax=unclassified Agrobacterium TaxID=2632611 RepID=UPI00244D3DBA|nr:MULTISPECIES: FAD-binding oxidoreductase [unclassified Agrobacterium]MDH0614560.1 FAD-binding oxidoreductase [Agrobacterium sp. GD03872]MDH0697197.1 FAD-binding oxidoreductase [Agrobacterium sp. GD03871]MDH1059677.1 FAD-binding oxidoreductase [Agrobacterium sp. GD03992]MDH2212538.1 FAD-binding oxidoreductase [Agrobacterium sp. GD03643]MDH2219840.1 FAD-binding oxidoreductase [Agrobacterium sp. GD03638]
MYNDPRSHGLWEKTAPQPPATPALQSAVAADVVVVGGGFTGQSAALHLAERSVDVVLLEAREIGFGGAGRNVGLINGGMWVMPKELPGVLGETYGERLLDLLGNAPLLVRELVEKHVIACEIEKNGTLHCAVGEKGLAEIRERCDQWAARGAPVRVLDADETARRTGSTGYAGALFDSRAGTLQPLAYVRGLAVAAQKAGARLHTASPVVSTERSGEKWLVKTPQGSVTAKWIVVATEAYSTGPWQIVRDEQIYLPYFNFATRPLGDNLQKSILPGREGCWDTKEILSSFRMDKAGRLIFGSVGALRGTGAAIHRAWAKRSLKRLFPQLGDTEFECEWYGQIGMTDNAVPRFHSFADNVIGFSGYNGRGIAPGTAFGKVIARHILGDIAEGDLPLPATEPKAQAFRAVKEAYYEAGAQIAHFAGERF